MTSPTFIKTATSGIALAGALILSGSVQSAASQGTSRGPCTVDALGNPLRGQTRYSEPVGEPGTACTNPDAEGNPGGTWVTGATLGAVGGRTGPASGTTSSSVDRLDVVEVGPLTTDDYVTMAREARKLLDYHRTMRESISPYRSEGIANFDNLVRTFESNKKGFDQVIDYWDPATFDVRRKPGTELPTKSGSRPLGEQIAISEAALRRAWTIYAHLAVATDQQTIVGKLPITDTLTPSILQKSDCADVNEAQAKFSDTGTYTVTRNYCDFAARMREAVREAAYLHTIFAQQFLSDAMRVRTSAELDKWNPNSLTGHELTSLASALDQFNAARNVVAEAFQLPIGVLCNGADLFTEQELQLLANINEGRSETLYEMAVRNSYARSAITMAQAQDGVRKEYRDTAIDQYVQLAGIASGQAAADGPPRCGRLAVTTDDKLRVEMAQQVNGALNKTIQRIRELGAGRNIFGFDVEFTPALSANDLKASLTAAIDQAEAADARVESAERNYETSVAQLRASVLNIRTDVEGRLRRLIGCNATEDPVACAEDLVTSKLTIECFPQMPDEVQSYADYERAWTAADYESCHSRIGGDIADAHATLRTEYLRIMAGQAQVDTLHARIDHELDANTTIKGIMKNEAEAMSAQVYADTYMSSVTEGPSAVAKLGGVVSAAAPLVGSLKKDPTGTTTTTTSTRPVVPSRVSLSMNSVVNSASPISPLDSTVVMRPAEPVTIIAGVVSLVGFLMSLFGGTEEKAHPYCKYNDVAKFIKHVKQQCAAKYTFQGLILDKAKFDACLVEADRMRDVAPDNLDELMCPLGDARKKGVLRQAMAQIDILGARSVQTVKGLFAEAAGLMVAQQVTAQQYQTAMGRFVDVLNEIQLSLVELDRMKRYAVTSPANDPSFRLLMDQKRIEYGRAVRTAKMWAYLYAKRVEFDASMPLSDSRDSVAPVNISDIYRARTPTDVEGFQARVDTFRTAANASSVWSPEQSSFTLSYARDVLNLPEDSSDELFGQWAKTHTAPVMTSNGLRDAIDASFALPISAGGILSQVYLSDFGQMWRHQIATEPGKGVSVRLRWEGVGRTQQTNLVYRRVHVRQSGVQQVRSFRGCILDYRLVHPQFLLGYSWPPEVDPGQVYSSVRARVENCADPRYCNEVSTQFAGRPVAASEWWVRIFTQKDSGGFDDMDPEFLTDIEIQFDTDRSTRSTSFVPSAADCLRSQY